MPPFRKPGAVFPGRVRNGPVWGRENGPENNLKFFLYRQGTPMNDFLGIMHALARQGRSPRTARSKEFP
jgi:hypothetical protein